MNLRPAATALWVVLAAGAAPAGEAPGPAPPPPAPAGEPAPAFAPMPAIYRDGWIDFDKNGRRDVYEDPAAPIDARVEDLLALYTRDLVSSVTTYEQNLRGFERVHLAPGQARTLRFVLRPGDMSLLDRDMRRVVEPGMFKVMVGGGSDDIRLVGTFEVTQ